MTERDTVSLKEHFTGEIKHLKELLEERDKQFAIIQTYNKQLEEKAGEAVKLALDQSNQRMTDHNGILDKMEKLSETFVNKEMQGSLETRVKNVEDREQKRSSDKTVIVALITSVAAIIAAIAVAFLK